MNALRKITNNLPLFLLPFLVALILFPYVGKRNPGGAGALMVGPDTLTTAKQPETIRLLFLGDLMQHMPQVYSAYNATTGRHEYKDCFRYVSSLWQSADFTIANLETTLADGGYSGYPRFVSPRSLVEDLYDMGVKVMVTANNHSCDNGAKGIDQTLRILDSIGIAHTGTFRDSVEFRRLTPLVLEKEGFRIALLNYTYGTNGLPVPQGMIVNPIDTIGMLRDIQAARRLEATHVILCIHWGIEYSTRPSAEQHRLAQWCHRNGADAVIGSHPHVVQPIEFAVTDDGPKEITVFSLGNYISNQREPRTDGGISVLLEIQRDTTGHFTYDLSYISHWVWMPFENGRRKYVVLPQYASDKVLGTDKQARAAADRLYGANDRIIGEEVKKIQR